MRTPEDDARDRIDAGLDLAGWRVQHCDRVNLLVARGVAVREFPLVRGHGFADYLLYVDGNAAGVVEAKKEGATLTGVEVQSEKYSEGVPHTVPAHYRPLPFLYQSTGVETRFTNSLDPEPRSRRLFAFHRPESLAAWLAGVERALGDAPANAAADAAVVGRKVQTLRARLRPRDLLVSSAAFQVG